MSINEKQRAFAEEYAISKNATEAAKKAGYSEKTAYSQGQRLLKNVETKKIIDEFIAQQRQERTATLNDIMVYLSGVMWNADEATKDRIKAAAELKDILKNGNDGQEKQAPVFNFNFKDTSIKTEG